MHKIIAHQFVHENLLKIIMHKLEILLKNMEIKRNYGKYYRLVNDDNEICN